MTPADEPASRQLAALAGVTALLEQAGIDYWMFGGWAVDFYAGAVTRPHDDLDLAVWIDDVAKIADLLRRDGWQHAPLDGEDGGTGFARSGVRLELTYLARSGDGRVVTPLRDGSAAWPVGAFGGDVGEVRGVRSRLVAFASLIHGKSSPREDPREAQKDRADFEQLARLTAR